MKNEKIFVEFVKLIFMKTMFLNTNLLIIFLKYK